jgi:hypothetical protein
VGPYVGLLGCIYSSKSINALETKFFDIFLSIIFFSKQGQKEDVGKEDVGKENVR